MTILFTPFFPIGKIFNIEINYNLISEIVGIRHKFEITIFEKCRSKSLRKIRTGINGEENNLTTSYAKMI